MADVRHLTQLRCWWEDEGVEHFLEDSTVVGRLPETDPVPIAMTTPVAVKAMGR